MDARPGRGLARSGEEAKTCLEQVLPAAEEPPGTDSRERLSGALPKA